MFLKRGASGRSDLARDFGFTLVRSRKRKRTMSLQIGPDGAILIRAPYYTPENEIKAFFLGRREWIAKKLAEKEKVIERAGGKRGFLQGDEFFYLGHAYPLVFSDKNGSTVPVTLREGCFLLRSTWSEKAREALVAWYRRQARQDLPPRVEFWSRRLGLYPSALRITSATTRYGSCSPADRISLSWRLIMAPLSVVDYVIIHELVHIREKNHSRKFWGHLEAILPGYKRERTWLKEQAYIFRI
jgi:predicted metal-dependent hydrolase